MRMRQVFPILGIAAIVPLLYLLSPKTEEAGSIRENESWHPTSVEIATSVGVGADDRFEDERHYRFAQMFQKRYRDKLHAVGIRFTEPDRIRAMFAPVIPRWDMARIGMTVQNEAEHVFGHPFVVDIYETYITAPMKKLAECRKDPASGRALVNFDRKFLRAPLPPIWIERQVRFQTVEMFYHLMPVVDRRRDVILARPMTVPAQAAAISPRRSP